MAKNSLPAFPGNSPAWSVDELQAFFAEVSLPSGPISISQGETITDPALFVSSHLSYIKGGTKGALPYYERLCKLRELLLTLAVKDAA